MKATLRQIQLPGRVRLEFAEQGSRTGTPVIALHGVTDSWRSFEPVLPHLPPELRVIALSQRGHGRSGKPEGGYRPCDFAADVAAFMDAMEIERAVLGLIRTARMVEYADAGHAMHWEEPQRFALHLSRFATSAAAGAATADLARTGA